MIPQLASLTLVAGMSSPFTVEDVSKDPRACAEDLYAITAKGEIIYDLEVVSKFHASNTVRLEDSEGGAEIFSASEVKLYCGNKQIYF